MWHHVKTLAFHNLRIPLTICGPRLQLRIPQQLNVTTHMSYYLIVNSTNCSGFRKYSWGFHKFTYVWISFERYNVLSICLWNPKQQRRSKKSSNVADYATNPNLACREIRLQCKKCTVGPRNVLAFYLDSKKLFVFENNWSEVFFSD